MAKGYGWRDAPAEGDVWSVCQHLLSHYANRVVDMNDYSLWGDEEKRLDRMSRRKAERIGIPYIDLTNYPFKEVVEFFGTDYFTNTVDFCIALAIYEGYDAINLYGVTMASDSEYAFEKPGVEFWTGQALGRGIEVRVFGKSTIMKTRDGKVYGYGVPQGESKCYQNVRFAEKPAKESGVFLAE